MAITTIPSTKESVLALANIDPEYQERLDARGKYPAVGGDIRVLREGMNQAGDQALAANPPPATISRSEISIPVRDGHSNRALVYAPAEVSQERMPVVVLIHGGGLIMGRPEMEEPSACRFVLEFGVVCVAISYRLSPELASPGPVQDAYDAVAWIAENASSIHPQADLAQGFILHGTSSGALATDVALHLARDYKLSPPITGAIELFPHLTQVGSDLGEHADLYLSREQCADSDMLSGPVLEYMDELGKPDSNSTLAAPLLDPKQHRGLPPIALHVCGWDPLRDDGLTYGRMLEQLQKTGEAKVRTRIYPGLPHGGWILEPTLKVSQAAVVDISDSLRWLLGR